jgi:glycosyltransferase involved in cell wall biosynthesis
MEDVSGVGRLTREIYYTWLGRKDTVVSLVPPLKSKHPLLGRIELTAGLFLRKRPDWLFVPRLAPVPSAARRNAVIIHDLGPLDHPQNYPALTNMERRAVHRADVIFCISEFTASRVRHHFPGKQVIALPLGASDRVQRQQPERYLLCVAANRPNKRIPELLSGWSESRLKDDNWVLKLVSNYGGSLPAGVDLVTNLTDSEVEDLFSHASGYINVSDYEGLGLPVFQAIASGVPLLATSLPTYANFLSAASSIPASIGSEELARSLRIFVSEIAIGNEAKYVCPNPISAMTDWDSVIDTIERGLA